MARVKYYFDVEQLEVSKLIRHHLTYDVLGPDPFLVRSGQLSHMPRSTLAVLPSERVASDVCRVYHQS